jgi:hypothetical protein
MRSLLVALPLSILTLYSGSGNAGDARNHETYSGYYLDLSEIAGRQDFAVMADTLRHQIDIVEGVGLSSRVLNFFHTIPIQVDEEACLSTEVADNTKKADDKPLILASACYGPAAPKHSQLISNGSIWDGEKWTNQDPVALAEDTQLGVVMVRPMTLDASSLQRPIILHELLHAFHNSMMPQGFENSALLHYYDLAKSKQLFPAEEYLMTNQREFFAVTGSVFLYGKDDKEPFTREKLKTKQPDYYNYLVWLFGFDPDRAPKGSPVASAD